MRNRRPLDKQRLQELEDMTFEDWLEDQHDSALELFESYIWEHCDELTEIAVASVIDNFKNTYNVNDPRWDAYMSLYTEWYKNFASKEAQIELEGRFDAWLSDEIHNTQNRLD
jgi:hypothetical protein